MQLNERFGRIGHLREREWEIEKIKERWGGKENERQRKRKRAAVSNFES